jgi:hypothetical protein
MAPVLLGLLLFVGGQQDPGLRAGPLTLRDTELEEFDENRREAVRVFCQPNCTRSERGRGGSLLKEQCFVSSIRLDVLPESLVLHERVIRPDAVVRNQ